MLQTALVMAALGAGVRLVDEGDDVLRDEFHAPRQPKVKPVLSERPPLPPSIMTRQQRRAAERAEAKRNRPRGYQQGERKA